MQQSVAIIIAVYIIPKMRLMHILFYLILLLIQHMVSMRQLLLLHYRVVAATNYIKYCNVCARSQQAPHVRAVLCSSSEFRATRVYHPRRWQVVLQTPVEQSRHHRRRPTRARGSVQNRSRHCRQINVIVCPPQTIVRPLPVDASVK